MKVLLLTHNPISTNNNMGKTFLSLFSGFGKEELCQLYIYPTVPDVDVCNSYYRITDREVLKSLLKFTSPGSEITKQMISEYISDRSGDYGAGRYQKQKSTGAVKRLIRDIVWKSAQWYTKDVKAWLDRERPSCIFLAPGYARFIYDMALKISADRQIPIITYICDDYYFVKTPKSLAARLQLRLLKKKTEKLMKHTSRLVVISEEIRQAYETHFGVPADVVMTGASYHISSAPVIKDDICSLSYFGNLSANREISLSEVGKALDEINRERNTEISLNIYSGETDTEILTVFDGISCIRLCGFISGKEFDAALHSSDMLLHAEAFDGNSIDLVKHSVSTKIADCLAIGIPFFAYGPGGISSIKHLVRNECATVATARDELKEKLEKALFDREVRICATENALKTAALYHDKEKNSAELKSIFMKIEGTRHE